MRGARSHTPTIARIWRTFTGGTPILAIRGASFQLALDLPGGRRSAGPFQIPIKPLQHSQVVVKARASLLVAMLLARILDEPHRNLAIDLQVAIKLAALAGI